MSRTAHHRNQKTVRAGHDFGSRYNCGKGYGHGVGPHPKNLARSERRSESKVLTRGDYE